MKTTASIVPRLSRAALAALSLGMGIAQAASAIWTGGSADALWSNTVNWSATPIPGTGDTATFNAAAGAGGSTIDLGAGVTVNAISFVGPSYAAYTIGAGAISSQSLILNGSGNSGLASSGSSSAQVTINAAITVNNTQQWVLNSGANPWIINGNMAPSGASGSTFQIKINGRSVRFNGILADQVGGAKLQISGANANTATLTNPANTFTGGLLFDNGTVSVNSIGMIGSPSAAGAGGDLLFGTGFGGGTLIYTGTGNETDRVVKFNHGSNGPTITQSGSSGNLKFTADIAPFSVGSQTLTLNGSAAGTGEFSGKIRDNGTVGSTTLRSAAASGATVLSLHSVNGITAGASVTGAAFAPGTTVTVIDTPNKNITLSTGTTAGILVNATINVSGVTNVTSLTKSGSGTWTLSHADNTYTGNTTVNAGGPLIVNGGLRFAVTNTTANRITGGGAVTLNGPLNIDTSAVTTPSGSWPLIDTATLTETFGASFSLPGFTGPVGNVYSKTTGVQKWTFNRSTGVLSLTSDAVITAFGIPGSTGVINQNDKTIALTVPYAPWGTSGLATLAPTFTLTSGTCNQTSGAAPSPTFATANPATYTVTDGATSNGYSVTVTVAAPNTASDLLTFGLAGNAGVIDPIAQTVTMSVPVGTDVTSLAPTYTVSESATGAPPSGTARDFTNPQTYTVTAQDGTTQKTYTVTVSSYQSWAYSGSLFILTDASGANLPPSASEVNFPLLLRFNAGNFPFAQAAADGSDIRFSTPAGLPLPYEIEHWDSASGKAAVWVKIPAIIGNARQEIKMFWGKPGVGSQSAGSSVFNASNGYCAVMHLNGNVLDATGSISPVNGGASAAPALIGNTAMNLATGDITTATNITNFPSGNNPASTSQIWLKARSISNWSMPLAWGNKDAYGWNTWKMQIGFWESPPVLPSYLRCMGPASLLGTTNIEAGQWYHLVHTKSGGTARLYINGVLNATVTSAASMSLNNPQALSMDMAEGDADVDEARVSNVARSADWVKLEYENQKPGQSLVGGLVPSGPGFSVSPTSVTMSENSTTTLTAQAGGALKTYWIYVKNGLETVLAADQLTLDYSVARITGNDSATIRFKAVFADGTQTVDVPLNVLDTIPDPAFTLIPSTIAWDGRQTMTVTASVTNLAAMQAAGFGSLNYNWSVDGVATTHSTDENIITLTRSQGSGPMTVSLTIDNGGSPVSQATIITVQQPAGDAWVQRTPGVTEKPVNGQFFARDPNTGLGTIVYNGTQGGSPDSVYLKVYKTPSGGSETLDATYSQPLAGGAYAFSAPITAGLITYRVVYGTTTGGVDTDVATVTDLVCGDAYFIEGQSNALALSGQPADLTTDPFVRTFGTNSQWGRAVSGGNDYRIGAWGMPLALNLKTTFGMPICIINAAVGGTRIDVHMPNPTNRALPLGSGYGESSYADLFNRVNGAKLSHGIRGVFWHQGESNSGADAPTSTDWDYKSYRNDFLNMTAAWKQDFPNIQRYIIFQIQPKACGLGPKGDQMREVLRTLPRLFSNMSILSTVGVDSSLGHDGCHYTPTGYQYIANTLVAPLVRRDFYNESPANAVAAPNLKRAYYTNATRNQIALEFDQPTQWNSFAAQHFYLDDVAANISSGSHAGNVVTLQLAGASASSTIDYLQDQKATWDGNAARLITGANTIAALTFADVAIGPEPPSGLSATGGTGRISLTWSATTGATSYQVKRSTNSGGPYTTIASTATPTFNDVSVVSGTPYFYVVSAVSTVGTSSSEGLDSTQATATAIGGYAAWADGAPFDGDSNNDGVKNGIAWVLGAASPTANATALVPAPQKDGEQWVFEYHRHDDSLPPNTTQTVQYGNDLVGWTDIAIPATSAGAVTITPGSPADHVRVIIPDIGEKMFARLKVTQ
jgi:autotransporter-associated beta strand protein